VALPTERLHAAVLSFVAGYVDTLGFIGLFGLFTAHVTGNFSGMLGAAGMAVQNTYGKLLMKGIEATTVMTGKVTTMVVAVVDAVRGDAAASAQWRSLAWPIAGFTLGCAGGALAYLLTGFAGLALPCALLALLLLTLRTAK
jgi:uncharacterized membrane protein YoaK (UPF0700 family)